MPIGRISPENRPDVRHHHLVTYEPFESDGLLHEAVSNKVPTIFDDSDRGAMKAGEAARRLSSSNPGRLVIGVGKVEVNQEYVARSGNRVRHRH